MTTTFTLSSIFKIDWGNLRPKMDNFKPSSNSKSHHRTVHLHYMALLIFSIVSNVLGTKVLNYCSHGKCAECTTVLRYKEKGYVYKSCLKCINSTPVMQKEGVYTCKGSESYVKNCLILQPSY